MLPFAPQSSTVSRALAEALALHQQGHTREAQMRYARILQKAPGNTQARYYLGILRLQTGNSAAAVSALKQVVKQAPDHAEAHFSLGGAYSQQGDHARALPCFEHAVALRPDWAEAQFYLGMTLASLRRMEEALPALQRAIALQPDLAEAHHNLGGALAELGRDADAAPAFERAIALRPGLAEAWNGLGAALCRLKRYEEAGDYFKQAIRLKPELVEAYTGLGQVLDTMGEHQAAVTSCELALKLRPDDVAAHRLRGQALTKLGRYSDARTALQRAVVLQPKDAIAHIELAGALYLWGQAAEGRAHGARALELAPYNFEMWSPHLFNLHYDPGVSAAELAALHRAYGDRFEPALKPAWAPHANAPDPERPLRVGLVSGDFRLHSVGHFLADLLPGLAATGLQLVAYANQSVHDAMTGQMKPHFSLWRECKALTDDEMAAQIRADSIDVLVDLSGHTADCRLMVFARKPAPVQATWLGYPDTTGLSAIDYILGDLRMFPAGEEALYVETPWRLPDTSLCFRPPDLLVEVAPLPAIGRGHITFGCLNKRDKLNDAVIETWANILLALPSSRLLLQNKAYGDAALAEDVRGRFAARGIEADRLDMIGSLAWQDHMEVYNRVDIALDPFPYNGTTTSVEGLWMGVPLLALRGDHLVAHMGESIMHSLDMPDWIAPDTAGYVHKAVAFASDIPALAQIRAGLRSRLLASPICDASRFGRDLEAAFRGMWRNWCEQQKRPGSA